MSQQVDAAPAPLSRAERRRAGVTGPTPIAEVVVELAVAAEAAAGGAAEVEIFEPVEPATVVMSLDELTAALAAEQKAATTPAVPGSRRSARAARTVAPAEEQAAPVVAEDAAPSAAEQPEMVLEVVEPEAAASGPIVVADVVTESVDEVPAEQPAASDAPAAETPDSEAEPEPARSADGEAADLFEAAARLFNFTGETPIVRTTSEPVPAVTAPVHLMPVRRRGHRVLKRVAAAGSSIVVMSLAGVLAVGLTASPAAIAAAGPDAAASATAAGVAAGDVYDEDDIQAFVAPSTADPVGINRDEKYGTETIAQLASESGIQNFASTFKNDPNSAIQWPFAVGVPMSYGYGMRSGRLHEGIDFTPGSGAPIQAIADGVVRIATESGGAYGVTVMIDHVIDGKLVSSRYAHMQYGSLQVVEGQQVHVGDLIGLVGETGRAYGAHLHFELHDASGNSFDPWPWLVEHAGGATE